MTIKTRIRNTYRKLFTLLGLYPNRWSVGNAFKVYEYRELVDPAGLGREDVVLDLGCGQGLQTQLLAYGSGRVVGVDVSPTAIARACEYRRYSPVRSRLHYHCGPLEMAGLPADCFDHVFSFCVLEHIPNLDAVLAELLRIVKPGGDLHFTVDSLGTITDPAVIARHRTDHSVMEYFTADSIRERLQRAGFVVTECRPIFGGALAREEFTRRIVSGGSLGWIGKLRLYRRLREEDRTNPAAAGIMVLVRAQKPWPPAKALPGSGADTAAA